MLAWIRFVVVLFAASLLATLNACGNSPTAPSAPLDLTGTWSGQVGQPGSMSALRLTWIATHTGNVVTVPGETGTVPISLVYGFRSRVRIAP